MKYSEVSLPRNSSGAMRCMIVVLHTALKLSAPPAMASRSSATQSDDAKPNAMIATPQTTMATTMIRPRRFDRADAAAGQRGDDGSQPGSRIEQTKTLWSGMEGCRREHREHRAGHAEDHRREIHRESAEDHRLASSEAQPAKDGCHRSFALARGAALRRQQRDRRQRGAERDHIDRVRRRQTEVGDHQSADGRAPRPASSGTARC